MPITPLDEAHIRSCEIYEAEQKETEVGKLVREHYSLRKAEFIESILSPEELSIIREPEEFYAMAKVKFILKTSPELVIGFESCKPRNFNHYMSVQKSWIETEAWLVGTEKHHQPTSLELINDFRENQNGLRFKIFYCLRFPDKVEF